MLVSGWQRGCGWSLDGIATAVWFVAGAIVATAAGVVGMRTFDCRVVLVDEMSLNELDGQAGLSDSTSSYDHQFILAQEL